jgi:acetone carboxylase, beta subunit
VATRHPRVLAIDAGGTMTDTFIVDEAGEFVPRCSTGCSRARGGGSGRSSRRGRRTTSSSSAGIQTFLGRSYADRLHIATHHHNPPLVPRELVFGVRGRIADATAANAARAELALA